MAQVLCIIHGACWRAPPSALCPNGRSVVLQRAVTWIDAHFQRRTCVRFIPSAQDERSEIQGRRDEARRCELRLAEYFGRALAELQRTAAGAMGKHEAERLRAQTEREGSAHALWPLSGNGNKNLNSLEHA
ncbi:Protein of unknown function [Gryllus bimaculatus]|nr:Protein of unknown function [Gryllus bimaculatus]